MEDYRKLSDLMCDSSTDVVLEYIRSKNINPETFAEVTQRVGRCSSPLGMAIKYGHLLVVNELINLGFDPNSKCRDYQDNLHPLKLACKYNRLDVILSLHHDHGVDIDSANRHGVTALGYALYHCSDKTLDVVKTLVEAGASVNSCRNGRTLSLLSVAIDRQNIDVCRYLISKGADVNARDTNAEGKTPLMHGIKNLFRLMMESGVQAADKDTKSSPMYAMESYSGIDVIRSLLDYGADVNALDTNNKSPLCYAIEDNERFRITDMTMKHKIQLIIKSGMGLNVLENNRVPAVILGLMRDASIDVIKLLMDSGADVNSSDTDRKSSLMYAIENGARTDVIRLLVESGADVNAWTKNIQSAPCYAIQNHPGANTNRRMEETVPLRSDVNVLDNDRVSPLICALMRNASIGVIRLLVESGADVNSSVTDRKSALMYAISNGARTDVIRLLVESGADVNALTKYKISPLMYAIQTFRYTDNKEAIVKLLIQSGADVNVIDNNMSSPLLLAVTYCHRDIGVTRLLVESGADVNAADNAGMSSLMHASANIAHTAGTDVIEFLVESGAEINAVDENNKSPVHYAVQSHRPDLLKVLVMSGADVNVLDKNKKAPLHYAIENRRHDDVFIDVVQLLVDSGADVNIRDENGDSLLMYELQNNARVKVLLLLLECGVDVCARNQNNISPLGFVLIRFDKCQTIFNKGEGLINLIEMFAKFAGDLKGQLHTFPCTRRIHDTFDVIRTLCSKGADIEARNGFGSTFLHQVMARIAHCSCAKCFNLVHFLIVDLNLSLWALNSFNQTPFHCALKKTEFRQEEVGKILTLCVQAGYNPNSEEMTVVRQIEEELSMDIKGSDVTSLQDICCFSVRRALGRRLPAAVNSLPIPEKLKQYVKLTHVETMVETPENTIELIYWDDDDEYACEYEYYDDNDEFDDRDRDYSYDDRDDNAWDYDDWSDGNDYLHDHDDDCY